MSKVTVKLPLVQLSNADVEWVSLVNKPANRIPFRITKDEDTGGSATESADSALTDQPRGGTSLMKLNVKLADMFGTKKTDAEPAAIAAIIIRKADAARLIPSLKDAGYGVEDVMESDDHFVLKQNDFEGDKVTAFKVNDQIGILVTGVSKAFSPYLDSMSFAETMSAGGFLPSLYIASEAMQETIHTVLRSAETPSEASVAIKSVVEEFGSFVSTMASDLPDVAFKMDELNTLSVKKDAIAPVSANCGEGLVWDPSNGKCVTPLELSRTNPAMAAGVAASEDGKATKDAIAPTSITCPSGQVWDPSQGMCIPEADLKRQQGIGTPMQASEGTTVVKAPNGGELCPDGYAWDQTHTKCVPRNSPESAANSGAKSEDDAPAVNANALTIKTEGDDSYIEADDGELFLIVKTDGDMVTFVDHTDETYIRALKDAESLKGIRMEGDTSVTNPQPPLKQLSVKGSSETAPTPGADQSASHTAKGEAGESGPSDDKLEAILKAVTNLTDEQRALGQRVTEFEKTTTRRLKGTVLSGGDIHDSANHERNSGRTVKSDDLWGGTALDNIV